MSAKEITDPNSDKLFKNLISCFISNPLCAVLYVEENFNIFNRNDKRRRPVKIFKFACIIFVFGFIILMSE